MMKLQYLSANQAWVFTFGGQLLTMEHSPTFYPTRQEAVDAARDHALTVKDDGTVTAQMD